MQFIAFQSYIEIESNLLLNRIELRAESEEYGADSKGLVPNGNVNYRGENK